MAPSLLTGFPLVEYDTEAVHAACARVRNICGWHIAPVVTENIQVPLRRRIILPSLRVVSVNSVTVDGVADDFTWGSDGTVTLSSGWFGASSVVVNLTHGYEVCPDDVRAAVVRMARAGYGAERPSRTQVGDVSVSYEPIRSADVDADLAPYRLPLVA